MPELLGWRIESPIKGYRAGQEPVPAVSDKDGTIVTPGRAGGKRRLIGGFLTMVFDQDEELTVDQLAELDAVMSAHDADENAKQGHRFDQLWEWRPGAAVWVTDPKHPNGLYVKAPNGKVFQVQLVEVEP